ncbi:MAG: cytosine permease [Gammaproteobacteria bacterium]|nr:cytosine permease [Gammaproteobacteria bacterium]
MSADLNTDYSRAPVPDGATISGFRIAIVVFGIGITLPIFFIGSQLTQALGFKAAALALVAGCLIVAALMTVTSIIGARTRLSTYMILQFPFGRRGVIPVNVLLAITYIGYFSATADIFGVAVHDALHAFFGWSPAQELCTLVGCVVMTLTAMFGFRLIERFSELAVPILALFMLYVVHLALQQTSIAAVVASAGVDSISFGIAISTVIGANVLMAVSAPDLARYARNDVEALKTVSGLALGYPIIMLVAGIPTLVMGETDIMKIMLGLGIAAPALYILVFSTWTTNTVNLYSAVLTLATVATRAPDWRLALYASALGTGGAVLGIMDFFLPFVLFIGIAATPLAGVYIVDFFVVRRGNYDIKTLPQAAAVNYPALIAWGAGAGCAWLGTYGVVSLTAIPALDSLIAASVVYLLASYKNALRGV